MKMFDYASLIRLLEIGVNHNSQNRLIVCENESAKKSYIKRHEVFRTDYVCTINDAWKTNYLVGKVYNSYKLV